MPGRPVNSSASRPSGERCALSSSATAGTGAAPSRSTRPVTGTPATVASSGALRRPSSSCTSSSASRTSPGSPSQRVTLRRTSASTSARPPRSSGSRSSAASPAGFAPGCLPLSPARNGRRSSVDSSSSPVTRGRSPPCATSRWPASPLSPITPRIPASVTVSARAVIRAARLVMPTFGSRVWASRSICARFSVPRPKKSSVSPTRVFIVPLACSRVPANSRSSVNGQGSSPR